MLFQSQVPTCPSGTVERRRKMSIAAVSKQLTELAAIVQQLQQGQQGKGGGKGTGKGGAKGTSGGKAVGKGTQAQWAPPAPKAGRQPAWLCVPCWEAGAPGGRDKNLGWRTHCRLCNRTKVKALVSAPYRQTAPQETWEEGCGYQVGLSSKARKSAARKERKEAKAEEDRKAEAVEVKPPGGGGAAAAGGPKPTEAKFTPTTEEERAEPPVVDVPHYGIKTLAVMREPKWTFTWPDKEKHMKTPQEVVADFKVCKSSVGLVNAKEREAKYQATLDSTLEPDDPAHYASYVELLRKVRAEIKEYNNQYVGGRAAIEEMHSKLQSLTTAESLRTEKNESTLAKAKDRYDVMEAQFDTQLKEIQRRLTLFRTTRVEVLKAYADDNMERTERFKETAEVWKSNIAEMETRQPAPPAQMDVTPAPVAADGVVPAQVVVLPPTGTMELTQEVKDYHLSVPWTPMDLPAKIPKPEEGEYEYWVTLSQHAQVWREVYGCAPCTYAELMGDIKDQSAGMASLASVIGEEYWRALYGTRIVLAENVVPCQLAFVLQQSLAKNRKTAEEALGTTVTEESMVKARATVKTYMADTAKRPKIKMVKRSGAK